MKRLRSISAFLFIGLYLSLTGIAAASIATDVVAAQGSQSSSAYAPPVETDLSGGTKEQASVGHEVSEPGVIDSVTNTVPNWVELFALISTLCAAIAALTPTPKDDKIMAQVRKVIDLIGWNFGGAKNAKSTKNYSNHW